MEKEINFKSDNHFVAILAGGKESFFKPVINDCVPKQFLDIQDRGESLLQATLKRFEKVVRLENIYVVTAQEYLPMVLKQLPDLPLDNVLAEPESKNTAASIAYVSYKLAKKYPDANLTIAPSDHWIEDEALFQTTCLKALGFTDKYDVLLSLGVEPTYASSDFGYLNCGGQIVGDTYVNEVQEFIEKPDRETAELFLADGGYLWNTGILSGKAWVILDALKEYQPSMYRLFEKYGRDFNTSGEDKAVRVIYKKCAAISIDFAVMENASNVYVLPASFKWKDIGSWNRAYEYVSIVPYDGSSYPAKTLMVESSDCTVHSHEEKLVVVGGLNDMVIVNSPEALLICKKELEERLRAYTGLVEKQACI
ncbi:mannose-1-phosphate guanylyltransferase [Echinicola sediminis]